MKFELVTEKKDPLYAEKRKRRAGTKKKGAHERRREDKLEERTTKTETQGGLIQRRIRNMITK